MNFCVLASGSSGNSIFISDGDTHVLVDAGISCKQICDRLQNIGVDPCSISALCVTHDHDDHTKGIPVMVKKLSVPVYSTDGTCATVSRKLKMPETDWNIFPSGCDFTIGSLSFHAFSTSHDATEPVGFTVKGGDGKRLGIATDLGVATELVVQYLNECDAIILESNYDLQMTRNSGRPWVLQERVTGRKGHLSNEQACEVLDAILPGRASTIVLAHISAECNDQRLAFDKAMSRLRAHRCETTVKLFAASTEPLPLLSV